MTNYYHDAGWMEVKRLRRENDRLRMYLCFVLVICLVVFLRLTLWFVKPELSCWHKGRAGGVRGSPSLTARQPCPPASDKAAGARPKGCSRSALVVKPAAGQAHVCLGMESPLKRACPDIFSQALDYIHFRESNYGKDPRCERGVVGKAGERGEWQITPIFQRDIYRLFQVSLDPYDNESCRKYIVLWLKHYRSYATSVAELYRAYNEGP